MDIKKKILVSLGVPYIISIIVGLAIIILITTTQIKDDLKSTIKNQNQSLNEHISELVVTSAKSYITAIGVTENIHISKMVKSGNSLHDINEYLQDEKFLNDGYIYLVDTEGIIKHHPDISKLGTKSIVLNWLSSQKRDDPGYYFYEFNNRDKLLYKIYNPDLGLYIMVSTYTDDFSKSIELSELNKIMNNISIGKKGYPIILTLDGTFISYPDIKYVNLNQTDLTDADGNYIIQRVLSERDGHFEYNWREQSGKISKKIIYFSYEKNSNFIICSTGYIKDFYSNISSFTITIVITTLLILFILVVLMYQLSDSVIRPIKELTYLSKEMTNGNLDIEIELSDTDEINILTKNFLYMRDTIKEKLSELKDLNESLEDTVLKRTNELKGAQDKLIQSEKMSALGGLVAGIAHELNTPIGIAVTASSHLESETIKFISNYKEDKMTKTSFNNYLESVLIQSQMILSNMNRSAILVKSFKQISVDQTIEVKRSFKLKAYIDDLLHSLKHKIKYKDIKITIDCQDSIVINSYPGSISQIFTNLILNSYIHGFENRDSGEITIIVEELPTHLSIKYIDNGKGIPSDTVNKIFEPFYTTKRNNGGTGLGLHVVYNIVNSSLDGSINCISSENNGVCFLIKLPY
ncbi:MAG: cache domain-containing protein [Spirochaetaceae bacterium]